jgi:hypothetical protein
LNADYLIKFLTKRGSSAYHKGCKALEDKTLTNGFGMTLNQTVQKAKPAYKANSATIAAAAASAINPQFQALLASLSGLQEEE